MKKNKKRFLSLMLSSILCMALSINTYAAEITTNTEVETTEVTTNSLARYSPGNSIDSKGVIGNEDVTVLINVEENHSSGICFRVGATGNEDAEFSCTMHTPNGQHYVMTGYISANGGKSDYFYITNPSNAGIYSFTFSITDTDPTACLVFCYEIFH